MGSRICGFLRSIYTMTGERFLWEFQDALQLEFPWALKGS